MISDQRIISIAKLVSAMRAQGLPVPTMRRVLVEALGLDEKAAAVVVPDVAAASVSAPPVSPASVSVSTSTSPVSASASASAPPAVEVGAERRAAEREAMIDALEDLLDGDPTKLEAFEELTRILTEMSDWKRLERAHRKMLVRCTRNAGTSVDVLATLWVSLGMIYRDRLGHNAPALECLRMAVRLRPDDAEAVAALRALGG